VVDLIGPTIKTLPFEKEDQEIELKEDDIVRITSNPTLKGKQDLIVVDIPFIEEKLVVGNSVTINYGKVVM
jgi:pyruvate kinase